MTVDFTNFDPSQHDQDGQRSDEPVPAGTWILAIKTFRRETRNGKRQIDFIMVAVLDADLQAVGGGQYSPIWEVVSLTEAAAWRLASLLNAIGVEPPLNVMSNRDLARAVRWRPFKARVKRRTYNGSVRAQIDRYLPLSGEERRAFDDIAEDLALDHSIGQGGNDNGGGYGDDGGGYRSNGGGYGDSGGGYGDSGGRRQAPQGRGERRPSQAPGRRAPNFDDDIPF